MPHKRKNAKAARSAPEGFSLAFLQQCGMGNKARSEEISFGGRKKILKFLSDLIGATPKPTIKYRLEGFSFFIRNAWELMLKAYLIVKEGEDSIYFPDNQKRTISLVNWEPPQLCWGTNRV